VRGRSTVGQALCPVRTLCLPIRLLLAHRSLELEQRRRTGIQGKRVLTQWFSDRRKARDRPIIGDHQPPSKLGEIQPDHWVAEDTTELLSVLHVLGLFVEMEPAQAKLLGGDLWGTST
jgi:hypothetical protein